jgi:hypothetical protein
VTRREYRLIQLIQFAVLGILGATLVFSMYQKGEPWWSLVGR